jgi:hypothetical protein
MLTMNGKPAVTAAEPHLRRGGDRDGVFDSRGDIMMVMSDTVVVA